MDDFCGRITPHPPHEWSLDSGHVQLCIGSEDVVITELVKRSREFGAPPEDNYLRSQIEKLADWITENMPGEPSRSEGAVDTAIRLLSRKQELTSKDDRVFSDGSHLYWSTHCRHGSHKACEATELAPGVPRKPAQCKTCGAGCICWCHED